MTQDDMIILGSIALFVVFVLWFLASYLLELHQNRRDWKLLRERIDERFKALNAEPGAFAPTVATEFIPVGAPNRWTPPEEVPPAGTIHGELVLGDGSTHSCELISPNAYEFLFNVKRSFPRRGKFKELGFSLTPEGMKLSLDGEAYPLSLACAKLVFETLGLEPWPEALARFDYHASQVELTLSAALNEAKCPEVLALIDELWAQCGGYFERFLVQDIDHSKATQLKVTLGFG